MYVYVDIGMYLLLYVYLCRHTYVICFVVRTVKSYDLARYAK